MGYLVLFYTETRSDADARKVLDGYSGYIMCDGYACYDSIRKEGKHGEAALNVKPVSCLVHIARKFKDALKVIPVKDKKDTGAYTAVNKLARISHIDNEIPRDDIEARKNKRLEVLKPALDDFFAWVNDECQISLPQTQYGKALDHALKEKEKVLRVLEDGRLELDNNLAERTVKPFVIGRKNWLFADTVGGAKASCNYYSIIETAKLNGLIPYEYLKYALEKLAAMELTNKNIDAILLGQIQYLIM